MTTEAPPESLPSKPRRPHGTGRAYLGLALLGWGLSILLGVAPHEDLVVGGALAIFGTALVATAQRLPEIRGVPPLAVALLGAAVVAGVAGHGLATGARLNSAKAVMLVLGMALLAGAPWLGRRIPFGRQGRSMDVATLAVGCIAVLGFPLALWALQAVTTQVMDTTPSEAFVRFGLLLPLGLFLGALGLEPAIAGQTITYATPAGPLAVEVGAACSGIQAMALFAGVLALFLWAERPGGRRLALWSVIGIGGVYVANLVRLAAITLAGYQWGADALVRVHAQGGWVFFVAWALLFARLARTSRATA